MVVRAEGEYASVRGEREGMVAACGDVRKCEMRDDWTWDGDGVVWRWVVAQTMELAVVAPCV